MMKKFLIKIIISIFTFFIFLVGVKIGIEFMCIYDKCHRIIENGDSVPKNFFILVKNNLKNNVEIILLKDVDQLLIKKQNYTLLINEGNGEIKENQDWKYKASSIINGKQTIETHYFDSSSIHQIYYTKNEKIYPVESKITNVGYMMFGIIFSIVMLSLGKFLLKRFFVNKSIDVHFNSYL